MTLKVIATAVQNAPVIKPEAENQTYEVKPISKVLLHSDQFALFTFKSMKVIVGQVTSLILGDFVWQR